MTTFSGADVHLLSDLAEAMLEARRMGFLLLGLDGEGGRTLAAAVEGRQNRAIALVLGAEGPGLRERTRETCDELVRLHAGGGFGSLNVSNAAAVALYAAASSG